MKVKIVARSGAATLIAWVEEGPYGTPQYRRAIFPTREVAGKAGEMVEVLDPDEGAPGGVEWETYLQAGGVAERTAWEIANELRRLGIWTVADLQSRGQDAVAAFQRGYGMDVQRLRLAAQG